MADRTVTVKLRAEVAGYIASTKQAAKATRDLGTEVTQGAAKGNKGTDMLAKGLLGLGLAAGAGVAASVMKFADFDQAMSRVQASTGASADVMGRLRDAALEAGARTAFSATEAAAGIDALAKAGVSTEAILAGGLNGALDLAAAGELAVGDAAEIAASAMTQFGLEGKDVVHIADLLAAGAGKAQGSVKDMGMALNQSGLVANQMGLTIEETTGGLAAFAEAGLTGSDAGTSFKSMLQALIPNSDKAATLMDELGLSAFDAQGNFIGLSEYAGVLQGALKNMSEEQRNSTLKTIFGSDAVRAAGVLYENGAAGVEKWEGAVNDAGFAQEQAAAKLDNLKGDFEAFTGSLETAFIKAGSGANGLLRNITQLGTGSLNAFSALPAPLQTATTGLAAATSAASLAGAAFLFAVPKVAEFKNSLADMGPRTQAFGKGLGSVANVLSGPWGIALGAGVIALGLFAKGKADAAAEIDRFAAAIKADSGAIGENTRQTAVAALEKRGLLAAAQELGLSLETVTDAALGDTAAMEELRYKTTDLIAAGVGMEGQLTSSAESATILRDGLTEVTTATAGGVAEAKRNADALGASGAAQGEMAAATKSATGAVQAQVVSLQDQLKAIQEVTSQVLAGRDASRGYEAAVDAATASVKANGKTLDIGTEKGRSNSAALDAIAKSANDVIREMVASGAPLDSVSAKLGTQRGALIAAGERFGMTRAQARAYADQVLQIPKEAKTNVKAETAAAVKAIGEIDRYLNGINGKVATTYVRTVRTNTVNNVVTGPTAQRAGGIPQNADGGWINGVGGPRDDANLSYVSNGEFIVNAAAAGRNAALLEAINSGGLARGTTMAAPVMSGASGGASGPSQVSVTFADGMGWLRQFVQVQVDGSVSDLGRRADLGSTL